MTAELHGSTLAAIIGEGKTFVVTVMDLIVTLPGGGLHPTKLVVVHEEGQPTNQVGWFTFDLSEKQKADDFCAALNWFAT